MFEVLDVSINLYAAEDTEFFMSCMAFFTPINSVKIWRGLFYVSLASGGYSKMSGFSAQIFLLRGPQAHSAAARTVYGVSGASRCWCIRPSSAARFCFPSRENAASRICKTSSPSYPACKHDISTSKNIQSSLTSHHSSPTFHHTPKHIPP